MHSLLGRSFVLIGLAAAAFGCVVGLWAGRRQSLAGLRWTQRAAYLFAAAMTLANVTMVSALLQHDFSVHYVSQVGSRATPTWVTIVSLWSSLEGSILFWGLMLAGYVFGFTYTLRHRYREYMPYALGAILGVGVFFAFLIAGPANPFLPVDPVPADGPGPNPLLQNHILMIAHPPLLYLGYVGMTIPFGIAVAALLRGQLSDGWLKPLRRWTMIPWTFLSAGIVFGGWWAYEVLGWGGYWAWDPVENASFLPWLAATGYLHATVVQERRRILRAWTLSLVLASFLLTILGTFMTRSGVFNSVHSFTQSSIGPTFLVFLGLLSIVSLGLLAGRSHLLESEGRVQSPVSREAAFVLNNLVFVVFTFTVLLGTVFPLVVEAVKGTKISVGEPYFNSMAVPMGLVLVFLMGVGPALPWGEPRLDVALRRLLAPLGAAIAVVALVLALGLTAPLAVVTFGLCGFAAAATLQEIFAPAWQRSRERNEPLGYALFRSIAATRRRFGGYVVHLAVIIIVAAVAASQSYRYSVEASLGKGEQFVIGDYVLRYELVGAEELPHRFSVFADLSITRGNEALGSVKPRLNYYSTQREPIGTPHVRTFGSTDLYLSLLNFDRETERIAVKAFVIPGVPWIWWGLPILVLGSAISLWPRRRTQKSSAPSAATSPA